MTTRSLDTRHQRRDVARARRGRGPRARSRLCALFRLPRGRGVARAGRRDLRGLQRRERELRRWPCAPSAAPSPTSSPRDKAAVAAIAVDHARDRNRGALAAFAGKR